MAVKFFNQRTIVIGLSIGLALVAAAIIFIFLSDTQREKTIEAPESDRVLQAQTTLPFQILIPGYLPAKFERERVELIRNATSPDGQTAVQLIYSHPKGVTLTLTEWMPMSTGDSTTGTTADASIRMCTCMCNNSDQCSTNRLMVDNGPVRIIGETSDPSILSPEHVRVILSTLAPAGGLLTYSAIEEVPSIANLPPAEEIPIDASGVQEVVLVVSPSGYTPAHFSVKKDIPVRIIFRQLGEVGCGNEIYIQWGAKNIDFLSLENPSDSKVLEFTPVETGDFIYQCPHYIYQGVMTVME